MTDRGHHRAARQQPVDPMLQKAVRVRRLTDPLGAAGQRRTGERIRREHTARRAFFAGTVASFVAILGSFILSAPSDHQAAQADTASTGANPIVWAIDGNGQIQQVQVVQQNEVAHVRTRSS